MRVKGLDSWRFWCALWVVFGHFGFVPFETTSRLARAVYNNIVSGPAAVIVFFVISGFCIHYPNRNRTEVSPLLPFYVRRYLRILIPVAVAVVISKPLGVEMGLWDKTILWSLVCEEVYYAIYPALLRLRNRYGWPSMIAVSYIGSLGLGIAGRVAAGGDYPSLGPQLNWLLALPCWLLGCELAESYAEKAANQSIWTWRIGALALSMVTSVLRFHSPITYPLTLNLFAFYVYFWLAHELIHARGSESIWPQRFGAFSYSLYLSHRVGHAIFQAIPVPAVGIYATWLASIAVILAVALIFYAVIESPSHRLARYAYRRLTRAYLSSEPQPS